MRAVVLARGLARRMRAADAAAVLTPDQAAAAAAGLKAMMPVGGTPGRPGRPFLDYILSELADAGVTHVALVVAPDHASIRAHYEDRVRPARLRIDYVVQREPRGTADAVLACQDWTGAAPFLVLNGDNLYPAAVVAPLLALESCGLPVFRRGDLIRDSGIAAERIASFALLEVDAGGWLRRIVEKPGADVMAAAGDDALVSMNCWRVDDRMFEACRDVPVSSRGEFELPAAIGLALERGVAFRGVPALGSVLDLSGRGDVAVVASRLAGREPRL